jgi:hypothetical protein
MAEYVLGSKYRAQRRTVTESVKANAELFPYNFELSKEDQRERVLQQVRNLTAHAHALHSPPHTRAFAYTAWPPR